VATATFDEKDPFITVPGDRHSEVARTLAEPVPQSLSLLDQFGLWGNLGVSLLGFTGAIFVLQPGGAGTPELSLAAALTAIVTGTVLGTVALALTGLPGAHTGAPAMVLLRGLFGARLSYLPTVLNILQCLGWGIFELVTIATAAHTVAPALPKWGYVLIAGVATALLTIRPLGAIRVLRRYATGAVLIVMCYLFVQLIRHPLPGLTHGTWSGYWAATDTVVAVAISFAPLAADYSRHSRSPREAFAGTLAGYSVTQVLCYVIGLLALVTVAHGNPGDIYGAFIALPVGALGFAVLATRELDQSFADVYSTAVSLQNLRPLWDRRVLAGTIAALATAGALWLNIADYEDFLDLIGSVFVPMSAVLIADYFITSRRHWDLSAAARSRWLMLLPWAAGFVTYQLINPGYVSWWASAWTSIGHAIGFTPQSWMSASILSFAVAAVITLLTGALTRLAAARTPVRSENLVTIRGGRARLVRRSQCPADVGFGLRLPHLPESGELPDGIIVPVDPQIGDRPGHRLGNDQAGGPDRGDLAARGQAGRHGGDQPVAEAVAGPVGKGRQHRRGHAPIGQQVARRGGARRADVRRLAQRPIAGVAGRAAAGVDGGQLPVRDVRRASGNGGHRINGSQAAGHRLEQRLAQPRIGRALAAHRAHSGADRHAPRRHRHAGRGDDGTDRTGALTAACQRERHGLTATTVTSTSHSGRASADTTRPVNTG
jgi:nucleobase:cation symporter-1, NCS1 family